jgi:hypothetical protein
MWRSNVGWADAAGHAEEGVLGVNYKLAAVGPVVVVPVSPRIATNHDLHPEGGTDSLCSP